MPVLDAVPLIASVQAAIDRHDSFVTTGHVLLGTGIIAAGVGAWLWLGRADAAQAATSLRLQPLRGGAIAGWAWRF